MLNQKLKILKKLEMKSKFLSLLNKFLILIVMLKLQRVDTSIITALKETTAIATTKAVMLEKTRIANGSLMSFSRSICGKPEVSPARITRIINGFEAVPHSWPVN
jgi:hypothetical protein